MVVVVVTAMERAAPSSNLEAISAVLVPEDAIAGARSHKHPELEARRRYDEDEASDHSRMILSRCQVQDQRTAPVSLASAGS